MINISLLKKLALEDFAASKYDIANFVNKTDFDDKLINIRKVFLNKKKACRG